MSQIQPSSKLPTNLAQQLLNLGEGRRVMRQSMHENVTQRAGVNALTSRLELPQDSRQKPHLLRGSGLVQISDVALEV